MVSFAAATSASRPGKKPSPPCSTSTRSPSSSARRAGPARREGESGEVLHLGADRAAAATRLVHVRPLGGEDLGLVGLRLPCLAHRAALCAPPPAGEATGVSSAVIGQWSEGPACTAAVGPISQPGPARM